MGGLSHLLLDLFWSTGCQSLSGQQHLSATGFQFSLILTGWFSLELIGQPSGLLCGECPNPNLILILPGVQAVWTARPGLCLSPVTLYLHRRSFPLGVGKSLKPISFFTSFGCCSQALWISSPECTLSLLLMYVNGRLCSSGLARPQLILLAALLWCVLYRPSEVWDKAPSLDLSDSTYTTLLPLIASLQCSLRSGTEYSLGM